MTDKDHGIFGHDTDDFLLLAYYRIGGNGHFFDYFEITPYDLYSNVVSLNCDNIYRDRVAIFNKNDNYNLEDAIQNYKEIIRITSLSYNTYIIKNGWWHIVSPDTYYTMVKCKEVIGVNVKKLWA